MTAPACVGTDPELWFSDVEADQDAAKAICARCGVRQACLARSLAVGDRYGVFGGLTAAERSGPLMITAEPTAHLRATVPMRHGHRSSYLLCRDGDDGRACAECRRANSEYQAGYRDHGPAVTRARELNPFQQLTIGASA